MLKKQLIYILIAFKNFFYNVTPFFFFKKILFILQGGIIGKDTYIHTPVKFFSLKTKITLGDNVTVNPNCYLDDRGGINIGNNVNISHSVRIYTAGHNYHSIDMAYMEKSVYIGNDVWIYPNVLIMPGVILKDGCIVLPGSIVTKSFSENSVVGGNPAKIICFRNEQRNYRLSHGFWFIN